MQKILFITLPLAAFFHAVSAWGQLPGQTPSSNTEIRAVQVPLSGRTGQTGSVNTTQTPVPGTTSSVNTLNTTVQTQGPFAGSANSTARMPFSGALSLREAVSRGVAFNLGAVGLAQAVRQAHGQERVARSTLLPNLSSSLREVEQQTYLRAFGIQGPSIPAVVGPFNYFDLRATLTQNIVDFSAIHNYRSAQEARHANELSLHDARDLVALAVGGAYLQAIAAQARVDAERAQVETAKALYKQTQEQRQAGLSAQIEVNQSLVQLQTQQQRLTTLENDLAKQKINLARLTGLPPTDQYQLTDQVPYADAPSLPIEEALKQAFDNRADLQAASKQLLAAERARSAARAERYPSLAVNADYGAIGLRPTQAHGTFSVTGTLRIPIWAGGRTEGDVEQAQAALDQRRAEFEDTRSRIESEIRNALFDLQAAASQVEVSRNNRQVARETLQLTRQRFEAGVTDTVEVVQSEATVASADLDYITSLFAHNLAKLSLARALGNTETRLPQFLKVQ
ncbi:MAG: TolC family protein [Bryobacteraceae bacterium]